jgi:cytoplasmic iron level regulating protein YaaA (DUF328/UPF0246 family)
MTNYIILLPPSEGKNSQGILEESNSFFKLEKEREEVHTKLIETIHKESEEKLEKLFDVKGNNLLKVIELNSNIINSNVTSAILRYSGVMFKAINFENMSKEQKENFNKSVLFIDGLFGLLKSNDLIPSYKLKISAKLLNLDLTKFWKEKLKIILENEFENKIIIDILPEAHRKVIDYKNINSKYYQITFGQIKDNKLKQAGHTSKELKGELINYICKKEKIDREYLENFSHSSGYKYSKEYSNETSLVYLKK